jgi:LPS-assembly protein
MYDTNNEFKSDYWEIDGLRHIVQPYMNWNYIPFSTEDRDNIYFFDEVDRISEQNFVRFGADQRFQTRREGQVYTLLTVENYMDFHISAEDGRDGLGDFGTKVEWFPFERFSIQSDAIFDMDEAELNIFQIGTRYKITDSLLASLSYYYRNEFTSRDLYSNGSTLSSSVISNSFATEYSESHSIAGTLSYKFNPKTVLITGLGYRIDEGQISTILLELQRRLHCWTVSVRYELDSDDTSKIMLIFYLNAYPEVTIAGG